MAVQTIKTTPLKPRSKAEMSEEEFNKMLTIGLALAKAGIGRPLDEAMAILEESIGQ